MALKQLKSAGATHLVLDLRGNAGGSLSGAVVTAGLFLGGGPEVVVYTADSGGQWRPIFTPASDEQPALWTGACAMLKRTDEAAHRGLCPGSSFNPSKDPLRDQLSHARLRQPVCEHSARTTAGPVEVWVDGATASASEILAGSLRAHCRAELVGSPTFGKGVVQRIFGLSDGGA